MSNRIPATKRPDEIEQDGAPNAAGIPRSTIQSNIWYHLGLAYYLSGDYERALQAYEERAASEANNDMMVATANWRYMTLRRLGRDEEAMAVLEPVTADMEIIENQAYHRLCLFYKGELQEEALVHEGSSPANAAVAYGIANCHLADGDTESWTELLEEIALLRAQVTALETEQIERKRTENKLRQSEHRYRQLFT